MYTYLDRAGLVFTVISNLCVCIAARFRKFYWKTSAKVTRILFCSEISVHLHEILKLISNFKPEG